MRPAFSARSQPPPHTAELERGSASVEFLLCGLLLAPLLLGLVGVGLALIREIQVEQLARDAGHMYASSIDFSAQQTANRALLTRISGALNINNTSPGKAVIFTTVRFITELDCKAGGYINGCANQGRYVVARRVVLGDTTSIQSVFGRPPSVDNGGNVSSATCLNDTRDQVNPFTPAIANLWQAQWAADQQTGQVAYVAEVVVTSSDLAWTGFAGNYTTATAIF